MSSTLSGINKESLATSILNLVQTNPIATMFTVVMAVIVNTFIFVGLWRSCKKVSSTSPQKSYQISKYLPQDCDADDEVAQRRSNSERSKLDKKLRKLLQKLQRKSNVPILVRVMRDPFQKKKKTDVVRDDDDDVKDEESDEENTPNNNNNNSSSSSSGFDDGRVWASGTGYGCSFDNVSWDMSDWDLKQTSRFGDLTKTVDSIREVLSEIPRDENMRRPVRRSCLILFVLEHLSTSSMSEMDKHHAFFVAVFSMLNALADHRSELHSLCTMNIQLATNNSTVNLWKTMTKLYEQAKQAASLSSFHLHEDGEEDNIASHIIPTYENMRQKFEESGKLLEMDESDENKDDDDNSDTDSVSTAKLEETQSSSSDSGAQKDDETTVEDDESKELEERSYVECMKDLQFDMVKEFDHHKFSSEANANSAPSRKLVRRLGTEFADLSVSLPLTEESSIYLRVSESRMDKVKFLIIPADGTPYAGGCFVFDAYFPPIYPDGPPRVNLMTTGGGQVRFNPNLYENGYVCLSLLGTWSGNSDGERWQPNISTFLQVVLSVQCLIFVPKPYYNEPGYEEYGDMEEESESYSQDKRENTVRWAMIDALENPTPAFKDVILRHFYLSKKRCLKNATSWLGENDEQVKKLKRLLDSLDDSVLN